VKKVLLERIRLKHTRELLQQWQREFINNRKLRAYGVDQLVERHNSQNLMSVIYVISEGGQTPAQYSKIRCWREWKEMTMRARRWRHFSYLHRKMFSQHLVRVVLRAWKSVCGKEKPREMQRMDLEPIAVMDRYLGIEAKINSGVQIEQLMSNKEVARLVCPSIVRVMEPAGGGGGGGGGGDDGIINRTIRFSQHTDNLCAAIAEGNQNRVAELLSQGADVNTVRGDGTGQTPLHVAAITSSAEGVKIAGLLLSCGADVMVRDKEGRCPLDMAVDPRVACLIHQHQNRLMTWEFTQEERRKSVEVMNHAWGDLTTRWLWKAVIYAVIRQRMILARKWVMKLEVRRESIIDEYKAYKASDSKMLEQTDGADDKADDGNEKKQQEGEEGEEGGQAEESTDPNGVPWDVKKKLWYIFPTMEGHERLAHVLTFLSKTQIIAERSLLPDIQLLSDYGVDLVRGETDKRLFTVRLDPETRLLQTPVETAEEIAERRKPLTPAEQMSRADSWFADWCIKHESELAAVLMDDTWVFPADGGPKRRRKSLMSEETRMLKAVMICAAALEAKQAEVTNQRRASVLRDSILLGDVDRRVMKGLSFARSSSDQKQPWAPRINPITLNVVPYYRKRTKAISVAMRNPRG